MISITIDHREKPSGIPDLISKEDISLSFSSLACGDYRINENIIIERKSAEDFVQSLMNNRLFEQCARMKRTTARGLLLIEGNPYATRHKISKEAVKGALLSVMVSWQIPVMHARNAEDCVSILLTLGEQDIQNNTHLRQFRGHKPKKIKTHRLRFLQGLPGTGPKLAHRLYEHFGDIKSIVNASTEELQQVEGIGKKSAKRIVEFLSMR